MLCAKHSVLRCFNVKAYYSNLGILRLLMDHFYYTLLRYRATIWLKSQSSGSETIYLPAVSQTILSVQSKIQCCAIDVQAGVGLSQALMD